MVDLLADGLKQGEHDLKLIMMCEIPSTSTLLADEFLQIFDGFSDRLQRPDPAQPRLDRDSGLVANLFDERDPAVKELLAMAISAANKAGKYIGICGQGPSDHRTCLSG